MKVLAVVLRSALLALVLCLGLSTRGATETNVAAQPVTSEDANSQELMRAYLQLQEQIHATQLAVEQTRKEAQDASAKSAEALAGRLQAIETALSGQRARELDAMQSANRVMLFMAGTFAVIGFVAMLVMAYFQWRTVHGLAEISAVLPPLRALPPAPAVTALPAGDSHLAGFGRVEEANSRLLGALEQLEKRILDLEHGSRPSLPAAAAETNGNGNGVGQHGNAGQAAAGSGQSAGDDSGQAKNALSGLLSEGQKLLDQEQPEAALKKFEEAIALFPRDAEALVKKGIALEKLQKQQEAIACYDAAISADASLTIAYLHKGGLFNRMERFNEALECYEKALRTQEKRGI